MISIRKNSERGKTQWEWLESYHSFSFAEFYNPAMIHFGALRVINEDFISGGGGFPMHPHKDMEIITWVTSGAIEHQDSMGSREIIRPGEIQKMSAGRGVYHSEFNADPKAMLHLFQIWIVPEQRNLQPYYETVKYDPAKMLNSLLLVGSPDKIEDTVTIHQDVKLFLAKVEKGRTVEYLNHEGRGIYVHVAKGNLSIGEYAAGQGDAFMITGDEVLQIQAEQDSEFLLFDTIME
ncbi:MAG: pirin family protein [Ignavibacteria bacterium]|nr:pirin family protein [Ignavibacteria bacterium]